MATVAGNMGHFTSLFSSFLPSIWGVSPKDCIFLSRFGTFFRPIRCQPFAILPMVSAGADSTIVLRRDGVAVARGLDTDGQCTIPPLADGMTYTQVSAGQYLKYFSELMVLLWLVD